MDNQSQNDHGNQKTYTIYVNTRATTWNDHKISYDQVVKIAFPTPPGTNITYTVVYRKGDDSKRDGTLTQGKDVPVKDGMIFDVTATVES
jgi:hypothetical protein